ncbi:hypothetical protein BDZ89DRAFT_1064727 [Hymenopellis radicata]|nr:hypothetical protein BDZ89DRAFT_1064727 [Hymenopellis radicata]
MDIIDITTSSSDEADDYHPRPARVPRKALKKGKGKARAPTPDSDVLVISSSTSGADDDWREGSEHASASGSHDVIDVDSGSNEPDPLAQVLEIVPDVDPAFVEELIAKNLPTYGDKVVETVLHTLLEDRSYPKSVKKRKSQLAAVGGSAPKKAKVDHGQIDYASTNRKFTGGVFYNDLAVDQLTVDFPDIPKAHLRKLLASKKGLYAPTHIFIADQKTRGIPMGYVPKKTAVRTKGKGRAREDAELEREKAWLARREQAPPPEEEVAEGEGIECGCCFTEYPFDKMVQCPDAHLFCSDCVTQYAETQLGSHDSSILCMDQSGCKHPFPDSELRRLLSPKLWELYERVKQRKEIEAAGLEGLEECPFCEYKCVIENPEEKLFRCGNEDTCGAVSCRNCKKPDHLPKSCKEMEEDKHLDGRHLIEEAMTEALMRKCPKCTKAFIKDAGCNKMICPNCTTMSCYVCRQVITGYEHFNQQPPGHPTTAAMSKKCLLWDSVDARHADEVKAAQEKALAQYRAENPDVDESAVKVDLPPPPPPAPTNTVNPYAAAINAQHAPGFGPFYGMPRMGFAFPIPAAPIPQVHVPRARRGRRR